MASLMTLIMVIIVVIALPHLAADFTGREFCRVDIGIGGVRAQRSDNCAKVSLCNVLCRDRYHTRCGYGAGYGSAACRAGWRPGWAISQIRAQKGKDTARHVHFAEMDMRLRHVRA